MHVIVGTPGRIMDHLDKKTLDLTQLRFLVLDEADEMLNMGFAEDVETILADTPEDKQVALFSATMPAQIRRLSTKYLHDPVEITVKNTATTTPSITQRYLTVSYPQKVDALTRILEVENFEGMIVFVRTKNETETLAEKLRARGYSAAAINGDVVQNVRERTVNRSRRASSTSSSPPTWPRAASTSSGSATSSTTTSPPTPSPTCTASAAPAGPAARATPSRSSRPRERYLLKHIEKATKQTLVQMSLPTAEDVNSTRLARFDDAISAALSETERVDFFRDVVAHYVSEHNVPEVDVAAALAVVLQGDEPLLLDPAKEKPIRAPREERDDRGERASGAKAERHRARSDSDLATYRIAVGKRHKVEPRQIVGAIANEGGLSRKDFGAIKILPDFSLVELPADLPASTWDALRSTRISGKLIDLKKDDGPPAGRPAHRPDERPDKKPRHKKS